MISDPSREISPDREVTGISVLLCSNSRRYLLYDIFVGYFAKIICRALENILLFKIGAVYLGFKFNSIVITYKFYM